MKKSTKLLGVILTFVLIIGILAAFGVIASAEDVGESSTQPEVTGVTLSGNGVTFDESTNAYTVYAGTKYVTLTVTGTNFDKLTKDHRISYAVAYACEMPRPYMTVDTVANTATKTFPISNFSFSTDFELKYSSDGGSTKTGLGVYVTYDPSYFISVQQTEGGTISVPAMARQFDTVTVDAVPDEGYILSSIKVLFDNDDYFNEQKNTFSMPGYNVTVIPTFELHTHVYDATGLCTCGLQAAAKFTRGSTVSYYATLEEAITAARSATGSTVTLLDDCSPASGSWFTISDGKFTLDLNGKQITVANSAYSAIVVESGNITLTDSAGGGGSNGGAFVRGGGTLRVEGGTYGGTVSITNGNLIVEAGRFAVVSLDYDENPGTLTMMGGDIAKLQVRKQTGGKTMADVLLQDYYLADASGTLIDPNDAQVSNSNFYYLENVTVQKGADLSVNAIVTVEDVIYNGSKQVPDVTVTVMGAELMMGVDFSFTYPAGYDITGAGTTELTIKGIGRYTGEKTATYTIKKATLTESDITLSGLNTTYNLNPQTVSVSLPTGLDAQYVTLVYIDGITALEGGPTDAGSYKVLVKIEGSPNYEDATLEYDMVISPAPVEVYIDPTAEFIFNLKSHTPDVAVEINNGLPFDPTEYGGTLKYENNYNAGTATVTVGGNFVGSTTFIIKKATPQVDLGAPLDTVLGGFVMDVEPTTTAVDKIAESITLTVIDGEGYSVSGNRITIDDGAVIGSTITVLVEYPGSTNYEKTVTEHALTVGVPAVNTAQLENKLATLEELVDTKASAAELASAIDELEVLINNAEITAKNYTDGKAGELTSAIAAAKAEVNTAYTAAINDAKAELKELINLKADKTALDKAIDELEALIADAEDAANAYTDGKAVELINAIDAAKTSVTDAYTAAIESAKADLYKVINDSTKNDARNLAEAVANLNRSIELAQAAAQKFATDADADLKASLESAINAAQSSLLDNLSDLEDKITEEIGKLQVQINSNDADIDGINASITTINGLIDALEAADETLGGKITDALNTAKSDLATAISTLEAKISEEVEKLQNQINSNDADIDGINASIAVINGLIDELKKADVALGGDISKAIEKAENELKAAQDELKDLIDGVQSDLDTTKEKVNKAIEDLKSADTALQTAINTNSGNIADLTVDLADKYNALNALIGTLPEGVASIKEYVDNINTALDKADDSLKAAINQLKVDIKTANEQLQTAININSGNIADLTADLANKYNALNALIGTLPDGVASIKEYVDSINAALAGADVTLQAAIDKVASDLVQAKKDLQNAIDSGDKTLGDKISALNNALDNAISAYQAADVSLKSELIAKIEKTDFILNVAIKAVQKNLDDAKAELSEAIVDGDTELDSKITALNDALTSAKAAFEATDKANKSELTTKIDEADAVLKTAIDALSSELNRVKQALENKDAELEAKSAELESKHSELQTFIIIVCVVSGVAFCGCGTLAAFYIIDKKKKDNE